MLCQWLHDRKIAFFEALKIAKRFTENENIAWLDLNPLQMYAPY